MFQDRAAQFKRRLKWDVSVDANGWETDEYDTGHAVYCIFELPDGSHGGSGRLTPLNKRNMILDKFADFFETAILNTESTWESTRFCICPKLKKSGIDGRTIASNLMFGGWYVARILGIQQYLAVFQKPMLRVYKTSGWEPSICRMGLKDDMEIISGRWEVDEKNQFFSREFGSVEVYNHAYHEYSETIISDLVGVTSSEAA